MPTYFQIVWSKRQHRFFLKNTFLLSVYCDFGTILNILVILPYFEENPFQKFTLYSKCLDVDFLPDIFLIA